MPSFPLLRCIVIRVGSLLAPAEEFKPQAVDFVKIRIWPMGDDPAESTPQLPSDRNRMRSKHIHSSDDDRYIGFTR